MPDKSFTSSERKGILAVAGIALMVIALGLCVGLCRRGDGSLPVDAMEEVQVLDTVAVSGGESGKRSGSASEKTPSGRKKSVGKRKNQRKRRRLIAVVTRGMKLSISRDWVRSRS